VNNYIRLIRAAVGCMPPCCPHHRRADNMSVKRTCYHRHGRQRAPSYCTDSINRRRCEIKKRIGSPYSTAERRVPELIPVRGSQPAGDASHKPGGRLPLLSTRPAVNPVTLKWAAIPISLVGEQRHNGCNSLPKTVTRLQFEPGPFCD